MKQTVVAAHLPETGMEPPRSFREGVETFVRMILLAHYLRALQECRSAGLVQVDPECRKAPSNDLFSCRGHEFARPRGRRDYKSYLGDFGPGKPWSTVHVGTWPEYLCIRILQGECSHLPLRGRTPAATEVPFGSGRIAVAGGSERAVERTLVGALDLGDLGTA